MRGLIGKKDVLAHPVVIIRGFGWKTFCRCLASSSGTTFLEIISEGIPRPASPREIELSHQMDRLISFELRNAQIYAKMAGMFYPLGEVREFFRTLTDQEEGHAEILRITKVEVARRRLWNTLVPIKLEMMEKIDQKLTEVEERLADPKKLDLTHALHLVEDLEASEINIVFDFLLHSIQTPFLRRSHFLIPSVADHQTYLNSMLPSLKQAEAHAEHLRKRHFTS